MSKPKLLTEDGTKWFELAATSKDRNETITTTNTSSNLGTFRTTATTLLSAETASYKSYKLLSSDTDASWVEKTTKSGTLSDRIASMSLLIAESPIHRLDMLSELISLAGKEKRIATMAGDALRDLFTQQLLPLDRKLITMASRPLEKYTKNVNESLSPKVLMLWRFEETLKGLYNAFLSLIESWLNDSVDATKKFGLHSAIDCLSAVPEGEERLLTMCVNKLGDPSKKAAAAAGHQLRRLLEEHPAMQETVAREVQQLAHRSNLSKKALYNTVVFLNQLRLSRGDGALAVRLVETFCGLFEACVKKGKDEGEEINSRLLGALLTGVNRAQPYLAEGGEKEIVKHLDSLFRIVHQAGASTATQSLMLLFNLLVGSGTSTSTSTDTSTDTSVDTNTKTGHEQKSPIDRFFRALYSKLSEPTMFIGKNTTMFFNLIYKAMKVDRSLPRLCAFAKRLLLMSLHATSAVPGGSLFLLSEVIKVRPELIEAIEKNNTNEFDAVKREPAAAFGENNEIGSLWEASLLTNHFHPSVAKFSSSLLSEDDHRIVYQGDPLRDFTLINFLDRFAFRNPKSKDKLKKSFKLNESVAERRSGGRGLAAASAVAVNDAKFLEQQNVGDNEQFFYKFFTDKAKRDVIKGVRSQKKDSDGDVDEEELALEDAEVKDRLGDIDWANVGGDEDDEEEKFAMQLAEGLMQNGGKGTPNFDSEDVDMAGWSDLDSIESGEEGEMDGEMEMEEEEGEGDFDEFELESAEGSSSSDGEDASEDASEDADDKFDDRDRFDDNSDDSLADASLDSEDEDEVEDEEEEELDDGESEFFNMQGDSEGDSDNSLSDDNKNNNQLKKKKRKERGGGDDDVFADANEVADADNFWQKRDQSKKKRMAEPTEPEPSVTGGGKKKRNSRRKNAIS